MNLATLQARFRNWLVTGDTAEAAAFGARAAPGLNVYQNNYRVQLMGCLEVSYPLLRRFMGDEAFRAAAITHIDQRPPRGWTLDHYGADFADTLRALYPRNPDLDELAWIEWMLGEAFVAGDAAIIDPQHLAHVDWEAAHLVIAPSLRLRHARTNADDVWMALRDDRNDIESEMLADEQGLIVWRRDHVARLRRADAVETTALVSLGHDSTFTGLCDTLVERLGEEAGIQRAGELLAGWLAAGIVTGVSAD
ncbi:DNA-binding domain-containing protein [Luteibacter aegosomatissinici]|uniref:HvfC/BufC N-terminal domain-containing protein n=1 Tax=Luteibacter aegosomatissinici TaxID=2911539 RepID=UPI001FFB974A|nr:DNA-binding domain-containing protein [Luteibacter aegosomatissinici]UPG94208.1 DNA-binding domain-containing protein [Luteibacter aegosomatissinici]